MIYKAVRFPEYVPECNHASKEDEIIPLFNFLGYSGECPEVINGKEITLLEGEVLFLDTKTPHSVGILKENDIMINLLMSKEYLHGSLLNHLSTDSIVSGFFVNSLTKGNDRDSYLKSSGRGIYCILSLIFLGRHIVGCLSASPGFCIASWIYG